MLPSDYEIPNEPGVYVLHHSELDKFYIGQASESLRKRLVHHEKRKQGYYICYYECVSDALARNIRETDLMIDFIVAGFSLAVAIIPLNPYRGTPGIPNTTLAS